MKIAIKSCTVQKVLTYLSFPAVFFGIVFLSYWCFFVIQIQVAYTLFLIGIAFLLVFLLEQLIPYRKDWLYSKGDIGTDIVYLVFRQAFSEMHLRLIVFLLPALLPLSLTKGAWGHLWPAHWHPLVQLILFIYVYDFFQYWIHRFHHRIPLLWRFHAVHHSPDRLYFNNAPRFHVVEMILRDIPVLVLFYLVNADVRIIALGMICDSVIGLFQHCNIKVKLGFMNYLFSSAELHRWHHSRLTSESDTNFGSNIIIWDILFGSFYYPNNREVASTGLYNPGYPKSFFGQLAAPFHKDQLDKPADYKGKEDYYEQEIIRQNKMVAQELGLQN